MKSLEFEAIFKNRVYLEGQEPRRRKWEILGEILFRFLSSLEQCCGFSPNLLSKAAEL